ncbi:MAG: methyltransferase domain-containing protein [Caulobacterales bacterium]
MRLDVLSLRSFYASPLGAAAQRNVDRRISALWPHVNGLDLLGVGYATPYIDGLVPGARRAISFMPADQGVERWPRNGPSASVLGDENRLPFMDSVFDRVILAHALEESDAPSRLLRDVWRVMAPEGRLIVIACNRRGAWSLSDRTPFGHGRSFSQGQLSALLSDAMFQPVAWSRALYAPPIRFGPFVAAADAWERIGETLWSPFSGLVLVEAVKRLYAEVSGSKRRLLFAGAPAKTDDGARRELP